MGVKGVNSYLAGLFHGWAALGQQVSRGETIGVVENLDGYRRLHLAAEQDGYLICRRRAGRVLQGESAGVVIDLMGQHLSDLQQVLLQGSAAKNGSMLNT